MRFLPGGFLLGILVASGCGDSNEPSEVGSLNVRFDSQSCSGANAEILVDGASRGTFSWQPGVGRTFQLGAGQHVVRAREVNGAQFTWPEQTVTVSASKTVNVLFTC